ncbi:MAG TPA: MBL fold metallo-hydrolase [Lacipirellulaceae bacterium]|nr:MBL fold metallo-hydrolase [Lacipirellulaceae bacterium]
MRINADTYLVGSEQFGLSHLLDCNCYLIDYGDGLALIDAGLGLGVGQILANIESHGLDRRRLTHVLITHTHLGHWGGAPLIREATDAEIWAPEAGRRGMEHVEQDHTIRQNIDFGRWPADLRPIPCTPDHCFQDGRKLALGDGLLTLISVQGHTRDSTCMLWERAGRKALFTGDVVFYSGALGLINADGSSLEDYRRDLPKLGSLGIDMLFPGHSVFVLNNGQKHIDRALRKLEDFVLPESFFETNEFMWQGDYRSAMA